MRRYLYCVLVIVLLISLTACGKTTEITGIWEQEMEISNLGLNAQTTAASILRFIFWDDGTGTQEQIIRDGSHPDISRGFTYQLEGEKLILDYGDGQREEYSVVMDASILKMENNRVKFEQKRA